MRIGNLLRITCSAAASSWSDLEISAREEKGKNFVYYKQNITKLNEKKHQQ